MSYGLTLEALRATYPYAAKEAERAMESVLDNRADGGVQAQVAALAVRNLVVFGSDVWDVLVTTFGEPGVRDWAMAQAAYGPNRDLPGWTYVPAFALTESEARALDGNR